MSNITCCVCGVTFAVADDLRSRLLKTHADFFCPLGHRQHFGGESESKKLERKISDLSQLAASRLQTIERLERSLRATRAWVTRLKGSAAKR